MAALVATSALAVAAGLVLYADSASSRAPGDQLLPDLKVERPAELYLEDRGKTIRLRVSNTVSNSGDGPLEIAGGGPGDDCNLPGKPIGRHTLQNIYEDSANPADPGYFVRGHDLSFQEIAAGCSRFHPAHNHWHFDNFARYTLYSGRTGKVVGTSRKVSFCVIDTGQPQPGLPGSPAQSYYPQDPENPELPTCSETSVDGLSIGWEDTYGAGLPGQAIKVTGLPKGNYCLVIEADPPTESNPDGILAETNAANNTRMIRIRMRARKGKLRRLGPHCQIEV